MKKLTLVVEQAEINISRNACMVIGNMALVGGVF
jgi:hypothetical protein